MGRELKSGFVFSLDAFVAFSLILVSIQSLLVISAIPKAYYPGLLQADNLAQDTLQTISIANCTSSLSGCNGAPTILDSASQDINLGTSFGTGAPIVTATDSLIPPPYSYGYYYYNYSSQAWVPLYNASDEPTDPHSGIPFHRVQASSQILVMGYDLPPVVPQSPYCNVYCHGWSESNIQTPGGSGDTSPADCVNLPCNVTPFNTYDPGDFNVGLLRLVVWG